MACTILFSNDRHWTVASWVYNRIYSDVSHELKERGVVLPAIASAGVDERGLVDLRNIEMEEKALLLKILGHVCSSYGPEPPPDWGSPEFYGGFLERLTELRALVERERSPAMEG